MKLFLILSTLLNLKAQGLLKSQKQVIKEGISSTLLIRGYKKEKLAFVGAGFFVSKSGIFVTNHHVIEDAIKNPKDYRVEFLTSNEERINNIDFSGCSDQRKIDLCVLRAKNYRPKRHFNFSKNKIGLGQKVVLIGHCEDPPWSVKSGEIIKTWADIQSNLGKTQVKRNDGVETIETNVFQCGGDSGGPLFSPVNGRLVGMTTERHVITRDKEEIRKYMMSITALEIEKFVKTKTAFGPLPFKIRDVGGSKTIPTDDKARKEMLKKLLN